MGRVPNDEEVDCAATTDTSVEDTGIELVGPSFAKSLSSSALYDKLFPLVYIGLEEDEESEFRS